jgi:UDP-N-acetylmuramate dehydrogenase
MQEMTAEGCEIRAQAGVLLSRAAACARDHALTGFEFASGIPGTLGGGVSMNAGAYGGEMKDVLVSVRVLDADLQIRTLPAEELALGYRHSRIQEEDMIVTDVTLRLREGKKEEIIARMNELREARTSRQPLEFPSAGSTFKRPEGYFAGKLIMDAGLRGFRVGDAQVAEKHCGFVVNRGAATAADVCELIRRVQETVWEKDGVRLEPEVRFLGFD